MITLLGEAKGFVGVEIFSGDEFHEAFFLQIFHRAGGIGWFPFVAVEGDIERAGVEELNIFTVFKKATEKDAFGAVKVQTRIIEESPNFTEFVGSALILTDSHLFGAAFQSFLGRHNFLDDIERRTGFIELQDPSEFRDRF